MTHFKRGIAYLLLLCELLTSCQGSVPLLPIAPSTRSRTPINEASQSDDGDITEIEMAATARAEEKQPLLGGSYAARTGSAQEIRVDIAPQPSTSSRSVRTVVYQPIPLETPLEEAIQEIPQLPQPSSCLSFTDMYLDITQLIMQIMKHRAFITDGVMATMAIADSIQVFPDLIHSRNAHPSQATTIEALANKLPTSNLQHLVACFTCFKSQTAQEPLTEEEHRSQIRDKIYYIEIEMLLKKLWMACAAGSYIYNIHGEIEDMMQQKIPLMPYPQLIGFLISKHIPELMIGANVLETLGSTLYKQSQMQPALEALRKKYADSSKEAILRIPDKRPLRMELLLLDTTLDVVQIVLQGSTRILPFVLQSAEYCHHHLLTKTTWNIIQDGILKQKKDFINRIQPMRY